MDKAALIRLIAHNDQGKAIFMEIIDKNDTETLLVALSDASRMISSCLNDGECQGVWRFIFNLGMIGYIQVLEHLAERE